MSLHVETSGHCLSYSDGRPFFYLADTAWELLHRLRLSDAEFYLRHRAAQGFNAIQTVVLAECDGLRVPNVAGDLPLLDLDPARPNPRYLDHVDRVLQLAESLGMVTALLPTWGDKWNQKWGAGPEVFTPENARAFGRVLGGRFRERTLIWVLGGDRPIESPEHRAIVDAMAAGLREGDGGVHRMTFHPPGSRSSSEFVGDADWIDLHMAQTGHIRNQPNHDWIARDYLRDPVMPCWDGEPGYEDHPSQFDIANGYLDDWDVRKAAYWAVFSGACGHTYGHHAVWSFHEPPHRPINFMRRTWREALDAPGAGQMRHLRALIEANAFYNRVPDPSLIAGDHPPGVRHRRACRNPEGTLAMVYLPVAEPVTLSPSALALSSARWFNPRTGGTVPASPPVDAAFQPPPDWPDWVLILSKP